MTLGNRLRFQILKRDNFTCQYCGRKSPEVSLEVDHVVARANGGSDRESNLVSSCFECNRGKGTINVISEKASPYICVFCGATTYDLSPEGWHGFDKEDWCPQCIVEKNL